MKRLTAILLCLSVLFAFAACAKEVPAPAEGVNTQVTFSVYSLKGPTSMGLVKLLHDNGAGLTQNRYTSVMVTGADEITAALVKGDADIALLPANAAATLFNKAGGFSVAAVNTLGVLSVVENGDTIHSVADLAGKTVYLTGKGTTPEYALRHLLALYGIEDRVSLEFKTEAAEVVSALTADIAATGLLPQPFVTSALMQNSALRVALNLTDEWEKAGAGTLVTGVTVVRSEILEKYPGQIKTFLAEAAASAEYVNQNRAEAAQWIAELGIVGKAAIAEKAIPECSPVCITGEKMKDALSGYLQTLFDRNAAAVGGKMPADDFYYIGQDLL